MLQEGKREEAERQWKEVSQLLDRWKGVDGVDDVRRQCEQVLTGKCTDTKI
jgi:heme-degrading monooxygenase HmoA